MEVFGVNIFSALERVCDDDATVCYNLSYSVHDASLPWEMMYRVTQETVYVCMDGAQEKRWRTRGQKGSE